MLLIALAVLMALVSLAAGFAPLYIRYDSHYISLIGTGTIIAVAFLLVIPEGLEAIAEEGSDLSTAGYPLLVGYLLMYSIDAYFSQKQDDERPNDHANDAWSPLCTTSLGMIIHSVADGLALGCAAAAGKSLQIIIFLSVLFHKAPAAFSFATTLKIQGHADTIIRRDLVLFSLAAPVTALITHLIVGSSDSVGWWTGHGLLFSAGTFVFVAVHVQPAVHSVKDIAIVLSGSIFPIIATFLPEA